jgi:HAD superfamily hydrolase (TIGR01509 family)
MIAEKIDLFIFDWDGTLSTSTTLVSATRLLKLRYNLNDIMRRSGEYSSAKPIKGNISEYIRKHEERMRIFSWLFDLYYFFAKPQLKPGAKAAISELKRQRKMIAIFSDSKHYRLVKEVTELGLADSIDMVLSAETVNVYKPNPSAILAIAKEFGILKGRTMYVGDMASDIMTAKFAGMKSCGICGGMDPCRVVRAAKPDMVFRSMAEFAKSLKSSGRKASRQALHRRT